MHKQLPHQKSKRLRGRFPEEEQELYLAFLEQRKKSRKVSGWWLSKKMKALVRRSQPQLAEEHKFAANWLYRFVRRFDITWRRTTKTKQKVVADRLPKVQRFHQGLRKLLLDQGNLRGGASTKWGRFLPQHRFNWDEIPWAFIGGLSSTWDVKVLVL